MISIFSRAHIYDVLRAQLPTLELDAVFEAKEELALAVKNALSETMTVRAVSISFQYLLSVCFCSFLDHGSANLLSHRCIHLSWTSGGFLLSKLGCFPYF
jgi:hypothetical protein